MSDERHPDARDWHRVVPDIDREQEFTIMWCSRSVIRGGKRLGLGL